MIKYGLISKHDGKAIEGVVDLVRERFPSDEINYCEVGLYGGLTAKAVKEYIESRLRKCNVVGIENFKDGEELWDFPSDGKLITGNSNEVYNQIADNSQHIILIDGNHSFPYIISDFFCYKNKINKGGFLCFHDAAPQAQGRDWQRMGSESDPDMSISVLKALKEIGFFMNEEQELYGYKLIFHGWDENDRCGGLAIFEKL